jgi:hypothetical protein
MPRIDRYVFGEITIDGQTYTSDVIILPDRVISSWWRKEGHALDPADLTEVVDAAPQTFIMGCGAYGALKIPEATREFLTAKGIELIARPTAQAVAAFNASAGERIACGLHLTC